jgi:phospholipase/lecithinase/hemolysin
VAALEEDPTGTATADLIEAAIGASARAIEDLHMAGARSFLVLNLPNIGDAPALRVLGPDAQAAGKFFTEQYNDGLEAILEGLPYQLADSVIVSFDVFAGLEELVDHPDLAGLTNVTDSCITPGVIIGAICRQPRRFLFWDFVHPTKAAHEYLSEQVRATLELEFGIWGSAF